MIAGVIAKFSEEVDLDSLKSALNEERLARDDGSFGIKGFTSITEIKDQNGATLAIEGIFRMRKQENQTLRDLVTDEPLPTVVKTLREPYGNFIVYSSGMILVSTKGGLDWKGFLCKLRDMYNGKLQQNGKPPIKVGRDYSVNEKLLRKLFYYPKVEKIIKVSLTKIGEIPPNPIPGLAEDNFLVQQVKSAGREIDRLTFWAKKAAGQIKTQLIREALISYSGMIEIQVKLIDKSIITAHENGKFKLRKKRGQQESLFQLAEAFDILRSQITQNSEFKEIDAVYDF